MWLEHFSIISFIFHYFIYLNQVIMSRTNLTLRTNRYPHIDWLSVVTHQVKNDVIIA